MTMITLCSVAIKKRERCIAMRSILFSAVDTLTSDPTQIQVLPTYLHYIKVGPGSQRPNCSSLMPLKYPRHEK